MRDGDDQEPGRPRRLRVMSPGGQPGEQAQAPAERLLPSRERKKESRSAVPSSEGNEARREGRRGVGALHGTEEAGELARRTPWRDGGAGSWN